MQIASSRKPHFYLNSNNFVFFLNENNDLLRVSTHFDFISKLVMQFFVIMQFVKTKRLCNENYITVSDFFFRTKKGESI